MDDSERIVFNNILCNSNRAKQGGCIFVDEYNYEETLGAVITSVSDQCLVLNYTDIY